MSRTLADLKWNRFSQFGEDGIIQAIFERIGTTSRLCIEFGAWDGLHFSNTANLWMNGWTAVLIEGHPGRFKELKKNAAGRPCTCINAYVGLGEKDSLEGLLAQHGVGGTVDLLSIDIDGDDYYVLGSLRQLRPRVIICEYNPTVPAHIDLFGECGSQFGCSSAALVRLAKGLGYRLVAMTETNGFFVLEDIFGRFADFETRLEQIRIDDQLNYLITSYTGDYVSSRPPSFPLGFPYRGKLNGKYNPIRFRAEFTKPAYSLVRWVKAQFRR